VAADRIIEITEGRQPFYREALRGEEQTMTRLLLIAVLGFVMIAVALVAEVPATERWFSEMTHQAGIHHLHSNRVYDNPYSKIMAGYTALGAAIAVADFDCGGYDDFFMTDSSESGKNRFYRNQHNFTFTDVAEQAGVADGNDGDNATSAALWLDFNNDGWPDLLVFRFGHNQLFQNLGDGHFKDVTRQADLYRYLKAIAATAFDYDHDGYVNLLIGAYFQPINLFKPNTPRFFPENFESANNGGGVVLFHNNGNGTFIDVTEQAGLKQSGWTLSLGHGDSDNDGGGDLCVASESPIDTKKGMNVDFGDFDNDGLLDIYVTNITDDYMREGN
jgi:hypothetical protein